ncbi:uncharacterized protein LOC135471878 [Liolophura sinensis]|uniref:uncharacterized protein LOC135471878 n=1 Tax=Liolophura sinensis TaxID=3198878 RepID=UPI003159930A
MRGFLVAFSVAMVAIQSAAAGGNKKYCAPGCKTKIEALNKRITALEERDQWQMLLRVSKGDGGNVVDKWEGNHAYNEDKAANAQDLSKTFDGIYKSAMVEKWGSLNIQEVKVAVYNKGEEKAYFIFDGRKTTKMNFFDKAKLLASTYPNLSSEPSNYFSIKGHNDYNRHFFMSRSYGGCPNDQAWFVLVDDGKVGCDWSEKEAKPYFLYSPTDTYANLETEALIADTFAIFIRTRPLM